MTEANATVTAYFEALNAIDREAFLACFAEDAVAQDPYGAATFEGRDGLNKFFDGMERTWREFQMAPQAFYVSGDRVAAPWKTTAVAGNGKQATFEGVNVFTLDDSGKIRALEAYWDIKAMIGQIRE